MAHRIVPPVEENFTRGHAGRLAKARDAFWIGVRYGVVAAFSGAWVAWRGQAERAADRQRTSLIMAALARVGRYQALISLGQLLP